MKLGYSGLINKLGQEFFITLLKSGGVKIASVAVVFLTSVFLSRILGPEGYGIYTYAFSIAMLASLPLHGGLASLIVRSVAQYQVKNSWSFIKGIKRRANQLVIVGSLIVGISLFLFYSGLGNGAVRLTHNISLLIIPIVSLAAIRTALLRGFNKPIWGQLPDDIIRPYCWLMLLVAVYSYSVISPQIVMGVHVIAAFIALVIGQKFLVRETPDAVIKSCMQYEDRVWLKGMLPFTVIAGIQMINSQLDVLMIGLMLNHSDVGVYQVAAQIVTLISFPLIIVNYVVTQRFAVQFSLKESAKIQKIIYDTARIVVVISTPMAILFIMFGDLFIRLVFGVIYNGSYIPLVILVCGQLVNALMGSVAILLNMAGHETYVAKGFAMSVVLNIILNLFLVPVWGVAGAATATAATIIVWNLYMARALWVKENLKAGVFSFIGLRSIS